MRRQTDAGRQCARALAVMLLGVLGASAWADWSLVGADSTLGFTSVKNARIAEGHQFTELSGGVTAAGAEVRIDLASVDTLVPIRNERMLAMLFEVADYPEAVFRADVDLASAEAMAVGESMRMDVSGSLTLHGRTAPVAASVLVTREASDRISVASTRPVVISADAFALGDGITRLREVAGLDAITPMVPVSFSLGFQANSAQMGQ